MSDDPIERAAAIARDRFDGTSARARATEERVLLASRARASRGKRLPLLALPLVAALIASTAWGTTTGAGLRALLSNAMHAVIGERAPATRPAKPRIASAQRAVTPDPLPQSMRDLPSPSPSAAPTAPLEHHPLLAARAAQSAAKPIASLAPLLAPQLVPQASEAELTALYRAAHRAQFAGGDPVHTLELWDRYLSAAPNGSLALEARYNRAITLLHLGRKAEASLALEPFARGDYGSYRQSEARALLDTARPAH